jgi:hypothetical protein
MESEFTQEDKKKLVKAFDSYSPEQLKDFIARALSESLLLTVSIEPTKDDFINRSRKEFIRTLKDLSDIAATKLASKEKKLKEVV